MINYYFKLRFSINYSIKIKKRSETKNINIFGLKIKGYDLFITVLSG